MSDKIVVYHGSPKIITGLVSIALRVKSLLKSGLVLRKVTVMQTNTILT